MKPVYHISPDHGFLNNPNGLAQFRGEFHVFYQWLPEVTPQGKKQWRHCVSKDLLHWTDQGSTLEPVQWYEKDGCYSGSSFIPEMSGMPRAAGSPISVPPSPGTAGGL